MKKDNQPDQFPKTASFPDKLFEIKKHEAISFFKIWYYIFLFHIRRLEENKELTQDSSSDIARDVMEGDALDRIEEPEVRVQEEVDVEISHLIILHFLKKQVQWFKERDFGLSDIDVFLKERKERINQVDLTDLSEELRPRIEMSIGYFEMIDEEIRNKVLDSS